MKLSSGMRIRKAPELGFSAWVTLIRPLRRAYDSCGNSMLRLMIWTCFIVVLTASSLAARKKDAITYGAGLTVNIPLPEPEVAQVVRDVVQNGIIRGTKEYNKDEYITGATTALSTPVFAEWTEGGKVFYKLKLKALDPQNFKDTNDVGTLAVRYVVRPQDGAHTILQIDARYLEDYRHMAHASNGSVEGAEYATIHDRLDAVEAMKNDTIEAEKEKQELLAKKQPGREESSAGLTSSGSSSSSATAARGPAAEPAPAVPAPAVSPAEAMTVAPEESQPPVQAPSQASPQTLEERVQDLRRQVERLVKAPGAPLKSAPFHSASTLQTLPSGEQVLVEISTPYWLGVETHAGQHGWVQRDELESLP